MHPQEPSCDFSPVTTRIAFLFITPFNTNRFLGGSKGGERETRSASQVVCHCSSSTTAQTAKRGAGAYVSRRTCLPYRACIHKSHYRLECILLAIAATLCQPHTLAFNTYIVYVRSLRLSISSLCDVMHTYTLLNTHTHTQSHSRTHKHTAHTCTTQHSALQARLHNPRPKKLGRMLQLQPFRQGTVGCKHDDSRHSNARSESESVQNNRPARLRRWLDGPR